MANLNAGDILNSVNSILGAVASQSAESGNSQSASSAAGLNFGDLGDLARVIQNTKILDTDKLTTLKTGLLSLASGSKLSPSVLLKLAPLVAALQTMRVTDAVDTAPNTNQNAWDLIKPFLNDKDKLSSLLSLFGEQGEKLLGILNAVFPRA